jgi:hypothetical protein
VAGAKSVEVYDTPLETHSSGLEAAKAAYQEVADHCRNRKGARPEWVRDHVDSDLLLQPATYGTSEISSQFDQGRGKKTQETIREFLAPAAG